MSEEVEGDSQGVQPREGMREGESERKAGDGEVKEEAVVWARGGASESASGARKKSV